MSDSTENRHGDDASPVAAFWRRFRRDRMALVGVVGVVFIVAVAVMAPLIANGRPLLIQRTGQGLAFPFFRYLFAPDSSEAVVEKLFNYALLCLPAFFVIGLVFKRSPLTRRLTRFGFAVALAIPFLTVKFKMDKTNWREISSGLRAGEFAVFAPVPYGPYENVTAPYEKPSWRHWFGTDQIGRDVLARMVYGARVSLAVGILATGTAVLIGVAVGMTSGYFGEWTDIVIMRVVEIVICFPTFLLLLILMAILMDRKFEQSILLVIVVIGVTGWTGLCRLVRGEVLKQRALPYIHSCVCLGIPTWRVMVFHLLPNVIGVILVSFTFSVAGAILAESGLSFLGFGVQPPTASWGELLRQAFDDPFSYWHLTLWPGLALFISVTAFNFSGEGLRKTLDPKS